MMIYVLVGVIVGYGLIELIFFLTHRKPLKESDIQKLMKKRRKKFIKKYYVFKSMGVFPEKEFKSKMKPKGKLYNADIDLIRFPSYTANLLKGKKHEWVVLACVKDEKVKCFYANKGNDNKAVRFNIDIDDMIKLCKRDGYQTIMRFHNHPNSDPYHTTCFLASEQDKRSAKYLSNITVSNDINWIDFVCERGRFLEFFRSFSEAFYPADSSYEYISAQNQTAKNHYKLQRELGIIR